MKNKKNMLALMIISVPLVMQSSQEGSGKRVQPRMAKVVGYVQLANGDIVEIDEKKQQMLDVVRPGAQEVERNIGSEFAKNAPLHLRHKRHVQPDAHMIGDVMFLEQKLSDNVPAENQNLILEILLTELQNKIDAQRRER